MKPEPSFKYGDKAYIYDTGEVVTIVSADADGTFGREHTVMRNDGSLLRGVSKLHRFYPQLPLVIRTVEELLSSQALIAKTIPKIIHWRTWFSNIDRGYAYVQGSPNCAEGYLRLFKMLPGGGCDIIANDGDDAYMRKEYNNTTERDEEWELLLASAPLTFPMLKSLGFNYD